MKTSKLLLTSGVVLSMFAPAAFAEITASSTCDQATLGASENGAEVTIEAQWDPITFNLAYAAGDGATGTAPTAPTTCTYDSDCTAPANTYSKTGYSFGGWNLSCSDSAAVAPDTGGCDLGATTNVAAGGSLKNLASTSTSTITLTANWVAGTSTVNYACGDGATGTIASGTATYGSDYTFLADATGCTKEGYTFSGWSCDNELGNKAGSAVQSSWAITSTVTCTAQWVGNTIGITWKNGTETVTPTNDAANSCTYGGTIVLPTNEPTKVGHTFAGWTLQESAE